MKTIRVGHKKEHEMSHTIRDKKVRDKMRKISYKLTFQELTPVQAQSLPGASDRWPSLYLLLPHLSSTSDLKLCGA